jgi:hypothetical protein
MADNMTFTANERLQLLQIMPRKVRSLRESVQLNRLREKLSLTDAERDSINANEDGSFDPRRLSEIEDLNVELSKAEADLVGYILVQREQEEDVPTSAAFVSIIEKFESEIEKVKGESDDE